MSAAEPPRTPEEVAASLPKPVMTARLAATVLLLEVVCVFFATLVAGVLLPDRDGGAWSTGRVWAGGGALLLLLVVVAGLVRRPGGLLLGSLAQGLLLATGVVVPAMWAVGAVFALLWVWLVAVGRRIDADRRRWRRQALAGQAPGPEPASS